MNVEEEVEEGTSWKEKNKGYLPLILNNLTFQNVMYDSL